MGVFDPWDWLVVLALALIVFGPKRLPEMGRALGNGIREFKKALKEAAGEENPPPKALPEIRSNAAESRPEKS